MFAKASRAQHSPPPLLCITPQTTAQWYAYRQQTLSCWKEVSAFLTVLCTNELFTGLCFLLLFLHSILRLSPQSALHWLYPNFYPTVLESLYHIHIPLSRSAAPPVSASVFTSARAFRLTLFTHTTPSCRRATEPHLIPPIT